MIGAAVQDYLKLIYSLSLEDKKVNPSRVAEEMNVSAPAVTKMVKRLVKLGYVSYQRSQGLELTAEGEKVALEIVRHHRLLELFLTRKLGYTWDEVHEEADRLEHVISEQFEDRIEELLDYPTHDPHGEPIPARDGSFDTSDEGSLAAMKPEEKSVIRRVDDSDPEKLRYMGKIGIRLGAEVEMLEKEPYGGSYKVMISGKKQSVGQKLAEKIFVAGEKSVIK